MYSTLNLVYWTTFSSVIIILSIFCFFKALLKKRYIMDKFRNISYSKISENIYNLVALNMFINAVTILYSLVFRFKVSHECEELQD